MSAANGLNNLKLVATSTEKLKDSCSLPSQTWLESANDSLKATTELLRQAAEKLGRP